jgi:branched-chain amino acid transport system permease protein
MRFIFKTDYRQDIRLAKHPGHVFWYSAAGTCCCWLLPWLFAEYWLAQLTFVLIYAIAGLGLMLLAGFTGLFSLGHAAFLGVGAYTQAVLTNMGWPFPHGAGLRRRCCRPRSAWWWGLPALRVKGIYLGMATLSFGFIVEEVFARWESVTGGNAGMHVKAPTLFGWSLSSGEAFYFLCLAHRRGRHAGACSTCCARPRGGPLSPSATQRYRRRAWAFTWRATRPCRLPCRPALAGIAGALCMPTSCSSSRPTSSTSCSPSTCC